MRYFSFVFGWIANLLRGRHAFKYSTFAGFARYLLDFWGWLIVHTESCFCYCSFWILFIPHNHERISMARRLTLDPNLFMGISSVLFRLMQLDLCH